MIPNFIPFALLINKNSNNLLNPDNYRINLFPDKENTLYL